MLRWNELLCSQEILRERNVFRCGVVKFCEFFCFRYCAPPIIITSMPMVAMYRVKAEPIIFFVKIVNRYFESKECFLVRQFRSFDGSVSIKDAKTLYLPVVHSKHTASYTG